MFQNCEKQQIETIEGRWVETQPVANRIEFLFQAENQLVQKTNDNEARRTFTYEILEDSISLSSNEADLARPIVVFFKVINDSELQIGNFTIQGNNDEILHMRKLE
ncbi:hypothetical protein [Kordia sp.]|uniref:hypothetical protein n=1 Tax=Kordia sp. TaxID=1965332 RepID=UPI003B5B3B98